MGERTLIDYTLTGMKGKWQWAVKHADPYTPGIADLSAWVEGPGNVFVECKALERWPVRSTTIVRLTRYTEDQKLFLRFRRGFLFLRVGREYLLFHGDGCEVAGSLVQARLREVAIATWKGSVDWGEFLLAMKR